ncbi:hypothetical protein YDYSG_58260 [Paenibacillus tyrfis]|uniref:hypothetical protein n=1 Tax=Paenibacillus tyrfis TaxID=1501230 RepID=UPI0024914399|nr:hypothetical protein [Paenibacillus tyrfis]GLI09793.1 hypothetical protein YDYSG_58260 [Paenibacillus tyrfis]
MKNLLRDMIFSSLTNLFKNEPDLFTNTFETNYTEWNLSHHLSTELRKYIFWLDCDLDVTKRDYRMRPDIIFHKRNTNTLNFLVVELKKDRNDKHEDIIKIRENWMDKPLKYRFGLYINIWNIHEFEAILFTTYNEVLEINEKWCNYLDLPKINKNIMNRCASIINEIKQSERNYGGSAPIDELDREIFNAFIRYKKLATGHHLE